MLNILLSFAMKKVMPSPIPWKWIQLCLASTLQLQRTSRDSAISFNTLLLGSWFYWWSSCFTLPNSWLYSDCSWHGTLFLFWKIYVTIRNVQQGWNHKSLPPRQSFWLKVNLKNSVWGLSKNQPLVNCEIRLYPPYQRMFFFHEAYFLERKEKRQTDKLFSANHSFTLTVLLITAAQQEFGYCKKLDLTLDKPALNNVREMWHSGIIIPSVLGGQLRLMFDLYYMLLNHLH